MVAKKKLENETGEKTCIKGLTMISEMGVGSNPVMVDVKDGKIVRLHPLHYDWKSSPEKLGYWELEAHGKKLRPTLKALVPRITWATRSGSILPTGSNTR